MHFVVAAAARACHPRDGFELAIIDLFGRCIALRRKPQNKARRLIVLYPA